MLPQYTPDVISRFWPKVDRRGPDECWPWLACRQHNDYGSFSVNGKMHPAHRVVYGITIGPIPDGLLVCHSCDVNYPASDRSYRQCVNPAHLWLGTNAENSADMVKKGRAATGDRNGARKYPELQSRIGSLHHSKLTEDEVRAIRTEWQGGASQSALARKYGIGQTTVSSLVRRETWAHIS